MTLELDVRGIELVAGGHVRRDPFHSGIDLGPLDAGDPMRVLIVQLFGDAPVAPAEEDYVELRDPESAVLFGGKVQQVRRMDVPGERLYHELTAQGWEAVLAGLRVQTARSFAAGTPDSYMLSVLLADNWGPISTTAEHFIVSARADMPAMTFATGGAGKGTLLGAIRRIWQLAGRPLYWIDPETLGLHWNEVENEAPYVLVSSGEGGVVSADITGPIEDFLDNTRRPTEIRVIGDAGVEYTARDWSAWGLVQERLSDEPGSPEARVYRLSDELDTDLTTEDACKARAFQRLAERRSHRSIRLPTRAHGFRPGQLAAVHSDAMEPAVDLDYHATAGEPVWDHAYRDLHLSLGWLQVQRISPVLRSASEIEYLLDLGDPEATLEAALAPIEEEEA